MEPHTKIFQFANEALRKKYFPNTIQCLISGIIRYLDEEKKDKKTNSTKKEKRTIIIPAKKCPFCKQQITGKKEIIKEKEINTHRGKIRFLRTITLIKTYFSGFLFPILSTKFFPSDVFITKKGEVFILGEEGACSFNVHGYDCGNAKYLRNLKNKIKREILFKKYPELKKEWEKFKI